MWFVYILENTESKKFYVGCTENLKRRVKEHDYKKKHTWSGRQAGSWQCVWQKEFIDKKEALLFEKAIKRKKSKSYIEKLIQVVNNLGSSISLA